MQVQERVILFSDAINHDLDVCGKDSWNKVGETKIDMNFLYMNEELLDIERMYWLVNHLSKKATITHAIMTVRANGSGSIHVSMTGSYKINEASLIEFVNELTQHNGFNDFVLSIDDKLPLNTQRNKDNVVYIYDDGVVSHDYLNRYVNCVTFDKRYTHKILTKRNQKLQDTKNLNTLLSHIKGTRESKEKKRLLNEQVESFSWSRKSY